MPRAKAPVAAAPDVPVRINRPTPDDHLEIMTRAVFAAGLSWAIIAKRWPAFVRAFERFAIRTVAAYGESDVDRLMATDGIIHSRKKIAGTIGNARTLLALIDEFGSIEAYVGRFSSYGAIRDDVHARFAFVGDLSCYYWLFRTGARVPRFEDWMAQQTRDHPRMREMVQAGRAAGTSTELAGF